MVAGPLPGVLISPPNPIQPVGTHIAKDSQPVTLTVTNGGTTGQRPLNFLFEVATDAAFVNKVFTRDGISPSDSGQTSFRLPDNLAAEHTYFWRAKAQDGANSSTYSLVVNFDVFTPVVLQPPVLVAPVGNVTTDNLHPRFTLNDVARSGPAGAIVYSIEVADSETFANKLAVWTFGETPGQTSLDAPADLPVNRQLFWRARGFDNSNLGPFSAAAVFRTPAPVVVAPPPPTGGGGGGGPQAGDQLNLNLALVYNSPPDVANWPVTTSITNITFGGCDVGQSLTFSAQSFWPDYTPPGWGGGLQYTVWAVVNIGGQWYTSGFVQMWRGRPSTGAPISVPGCGFPNNWAYDARWGPMNGYNVHAGETVGFFVTAGNARGEGGVTSVRERSNVILVAIPSGG